MPQVPLRDQRPGEEGPLLLRHLRQQDAFILVHLALALPEVEDVIPVFLRLLRCLAPRDLGAVLRLLDLWAEKAEAPLLGSFYGL